MQRHIMYIIISDTLKTIVLRFGISINELLLYSHVESKYSNNSWNNVIYYYITFNIVNERQRERTVNDNISI